MTLFRPNRPWAAHMQPICDNTEKVDSHQDGSSALWRHKGKTGQALYGYQLSTGEI